MRATSVQAWCRVWDARRFCGAALIALLSAVLVQVSPAANVGAHVNRSVPKVSAPSELTFSSPPTDAEFLRTGLFDEPLAPVGRTTPRENQDLAQAVSAYRDATRESGARDAVAPLLQFIEAHPNSAWKPALQLNLGMVYRQTGHFSKALEIWQAGWTETESLRDPQGRDYANSIVARLSQLEAYLGRRELLEPLLESIHARPVGGTAAQFLTDSHTGLYDMVYHPEDSFRCGPLALTRILKYQHAEPSPLALRVLQQSPSTDHGLSLTAVAEISNRAGMNYQAAFRSPGAAMVFPAVAHWKVGHYAAIVDQNQSGRYLIEDTTFGEDIQASRTTIDEEASGYFLIPEGPLPDGWRKVSAEEGEHVWGRGDTGQNHSNGDTGKNCPQGGCTTTSVEEQVVGLQLHDMPVGYTPPVGPPIMFNLVYSHRDTQQPTTFAYTNFGRKWTFTWLSYVTDTVNSNGLALVYRRGGGNEPYTFSTTSATTAYPGPYSQSILTRTVNSNGVSTGFKRTFPDGSFEEFDQALGTLYFMTAVGDPAGNIVTLTYDSQMRITAITDAIGQVSKLTYGLSGHPLVVTKITDPFGRAASFTYNSSGQLTSITDVLGITSSYSYGQGSDPDFINALKTPYGTSHFVYGDSSTNGALGSTRFLKITDPMNRTSYTEFDQGIDPGDSKNGSLIHPSLLPQGMNACNEYLYYRNTFVFDANQYALATANGGLNYSLGKVIHWLHSSDESSTARIKESEKEPLENRVWYNYPAQTSCLFATVSSSGAYVNGATNQPSAIGRVLDSGITQLQAFQYNAQGNVTQATDPVGRQWTYTYAANGIDRLTTSNTTSGSELLETRTYNSAHLPLSITGANGRTAHFQYNAFGQPTRYTDQLGHATQTIYDGFGHVNAIQGPISDSKYSYTYDNVSRLASATDPAGATLRYTYDVADRPTSITYPDGTTSHSNYTLLDLTSSTDRLGHTTRYLFDADREMTSSIDPAGNTLQLGYNAAGKLDYITDGNGHTTKFILDAESRLSSKQYPDGTAKSISYESGSSRIAEVTDALSQTKTYTYNRDDSIASISYRSTQFTPSVSFKYDSRYLRRLSMTDGTGTTTYSYYSLSSNSQFGANQLESISAPIAGSSGADVMTLSYDAQDRVESYSVNGIIRTASFDALSRTTTINNGLGAFNYGYSDGTNRVTSVSSSLGPTAAMVYFGPVRDEMISKISVTAHSGGKSLAQFSYTYDAQDNVKSLTASLPTTETTDYQYDAVNRLVSGLVGAAAQPQYAYNYDRASNLTAITVEGKAQSYNYTPVNEIVAATYDANGSPAAMAGNTYKWDGSNRLVKFTNGSTKTSSSFTYDGLGRLVRVVEISGGIVTADHSYFWCGASRCLAHDNLKNGSPVSTQYFEQGAIVSGKAYYYVKDRLGSVVELVDTSGNIAAQYSYDPYGNPIVVSGSLISDIGYAGYFHHAASGLDFALFRAYDPMHARWLNRDPIEENGGTNLYEYATGNPTTFDDPLGLRPHFYDHKSLICNVDDPGCTPADIFTLLRHYPAPGADGSQAVNTGDIVNATIVGQVREVVDCAAFSVTNVTLPGHMLYPGQVTRTVVVEDGFIYIDTVGTGTGDYAFWNELFSGTLWGAVDSSIRSPFGYGNADSIIDMYSKGSCTCSK